MFSSETQKRKFFLIVIVDLIIIFFLIIYFGLIRPQTHTRLNIEGIYLETSKIIPEFHFIDNHKRSFTQNELKGHWSFLFFGFTHCPMICTTTMSSLNQVYRILEKDFSHSIRPQFVFVTIDPDNDTLDVINHYVASFNPYFIGIRGEAKETISLEKQLSIAVSQTKNTIYHSAEILLVNPAGQVQAYFPYPHHPEKIARDYQLILKTLSK